MIRSTMGILFVDREVKRCNLSVGCDESGVCFANAHGQPEQCGRPCSNCDDSGDVHDQTGEWRGRCTCPAGAAALPKWRREWDARVPLPPQDVAAAWDLAEASK